MNIKFGDQVEDVVSGFKGIVVARVEFITGCVQYGVAPRVTKEDGAIKDSVYFDEKRLKVSGKGIQLPSERTGGPMFDAPRG